MPSITKAERPWQSLGGAYYYVAHSVWVSCSAQPGKTERTGAKVLCPSQGANHVKYTKLAMQKSLYNSAMKLKQRRFYPAEICQVNTCTC